MLPKSLEILRKFGKRPLTGRDFVALCQANDIEVVLSSEPKSGFYYFDGKKHTIVLSTALSKEERGLIGWHEFAHFLQNYERRQVIAAFSKLRPNKASEKLADVFALIATRPDVIKITGPMDFIKQVMRTKL